MPLTVAYDFVNGYHRSLSQGGRYFPIPFCGNQLQISTCHSSPSPFHLSRARTERESQIRAVKSPEPEMSLVPSGLQSTA